MSVGLVESLRAIVKPPFNRTHPLYFKGIDSNLVLTSSILLTFAVLLKLINKMCLIICLHLLIFSILVQLRLVAGCSQYDKPVTIGKHPLLVASPVNFCLSLYTKAITVYKACYAGLATEWSVGCGVIVNILTTLGDAKRCHVFWGTTSNMPCDMGWGISSPFSNKIKLVY